MEFNERIQPVLGTSLIESSAVINVITLLMMHFFMFLCLLLADLFIQQTCETGVP